MTSARIASPIAGTSAEDHLSEVVGLVMRGWMRKGREDARSLGLTLPQLFLIKGLSEMGLVPVTRWAEMIGSSPSAATALLDGLETSGLLQRSHDVVDRRQVLVSLTPKGRKMADRLRASSRARWRELCAGIPRSDLESAGATLGIIADRLGPVEGPPLPSATARAPRRRSP